MGIPLKSGRIFDAHDFIGRGGKSRLPVAEPVVVNEAFVRRIFPNEDPLGSQIGFGPDEIERHMDDCRRSG